MAVFVALAAVLALAALGAALWPLWRGSRGLAAGMLLAMGVATFALYRIVGTPAGLEAAAVVAPMTLDEAIVELQAALVRNPNEPDGWRLLGQSLASQGRSAEAREAFAEAVRLMPGEPTLLVEAAQSRLEADPAKRLDETAVALLRRALELDPLHQRASWLLGVSQRQANQPAAAAETWAALLDRVDPATATSLRVQVDAARADAGLEPLPRAETAPAAAATTGVRVNVSLDPDFAARARLSGDSSVFVIARVPGGPPMPVAVRKHALQELPLTVTLGDADNLMPTRTLSSLAEVEVLARLSASGDPSDSVNNLDSVPVRVTLPSSETVELVIGAPAR